MPHKDPKIHREYHREYNRVWQKKNREKVNGYSCAHYKKNGESRRAKAREKYRKPGEKEKIYARPSRKNVGAYLQMSRYGVSPEFKLAYWILSGKVCNGCGRSLAFEDIHIDHCHETGRFRGLLHGLCNRAMGLVGDDCAVLQSLREYLLHSRLRRVAGAELPANSGG